jgi:hypothetical protein
VKAGLGDNVNLDGWVALLDVSEATEDSAGATYTRVVDGAGVDLGDSHGGV